MYVEATVRYCVLYTHHSQREVHIHGAYRDTVCDRARLDVLDSLQKVRVRGGSSDGLCGISVEGKGDFDLRGYQLFNNLFLDELRAPCN